MSRCVCCLGIALLLLTSVGCSALGLSKIIARPSNDRVDDEALRHQVEADSFPTAIQAGV